MFSVHVIKTPQFKYDYTTLGGALQKAAADAIAFIAENTQAGEIKKGAIYEEGTHVYAFRHDSHLVLLSYQYDITSRNLLSIEVREGFFKEK
jgi:hypothetical protein